MESESCVDPESSSSSSASASSVDQCPDNFQDIDLLLILGARTRLVKENEGKTVPYKAALPLSCGLVLKCYQGVRRLFKKRLLHAPKSGTLNDADAEDVYVDGKYTEDKIHYESSDRDYLLQMDTEAARVFLAVRFFTREQDLPVLEECYHPSELHRTAYELTKKLLTVSPNLVWDFMRHPLHRRDENGRLQFDRDLLYKLAKFHKTVQRPEGTYDPVTDELVRKLADLPREVCPGCKRRSQIICGECGGLRMAGAEGTLPPRIRLPFDIMLLLHWHETLHKCTGIHAGAICQEGTVTSVDWPRTTRGGDIRPVIAALDPARDILLFPAETAIDANDFEWDFEDDIDRLASEVDNLSVSHLSNVTDAPRVNKHRIIVLEGSWQNAKTMEHNIRTIREEMSLPEIRCIKLSGLVGRYWKFHREGHSAVSTIEAIAHLSDVVLRKQNEHLSNLQSSTGREVKLNDVDDMVRSLLVLFFVQQTRVLDRVKDGGKPPQALAVEGSRAGSWHELTQHIEV